jgi:ATPase
MKIDKLVPDTSVIIEGIVSERIKSGDLSADTIIIHEAVLSELEHQANLNKAIGFLGLEELQKLRVLSSEKGFALSFLGKKPSPAEMRHAGLGEIDILIRDLAYEEDGLLLTADKIQARTAQIKGVKVMHLVLSEVHKTLKLESFFDETTMSAHLRENVKPFAKKGVPGNWQFVAIREKILSRDEVQEISREIIEEAGVRKDCFIEIERPGSTIVQLGLFRIVITKPPFSDGWEITAVRPVKRLSLGDYKLSERLSERINKQAEGILIAGAPGMGKSTFAQALAEFYANQGKIVKTVEAPRDLILGDNVTQYAISHGDAQEIHDILLLSRPDNTIFDEMRNTADFQLFADLRLAGIGLAGVVHATNPIDAIQRFVGRIELGVIPQVIDTVIFIKNGAVFKVLSLQMLVKVPSGMTEADLARPVVVVNDFETKKLEYELYSYGEETVVVPVTESVKSATHQLAAKAIEQEIKKIVGNCSVELVSDNKCILRVPKEEIGGIIGKQGKNIGEMEKKLGISIDVEELKDTVKEDSVPFQPQITKKAVEFLLSVKYQAKDVNIYVGGDYLLSAKVGNSGLIRISRNNKIGRILVDALNSRDKVELFV